MVYCGKASQGCQNCRTRRIKCDKVNPECSQCIRVGKKCPGYRDQLSLMFRDESSKVRQKAHAQWGVGSPGQTSPLSTATTSFGPTYSWASASPSSSSEIQSPEAASPALSNVLIKREDSPPTPPPMYNKVEPTLEDRGVQFFLDRYLMGHPDAPASSDQLQVYGYGSEAMRNIMMAVGLAGLSNIHGDKSMSVLSRQKYTTALQQTSQLIASKTKNNLMANSLRAVVTLALFEVVQGKGSKLSAGTANIHISGAIALVRSSLPLKTATHGGARAILQLIFSLFIPSQLSETPLPPAFFECLRFCRSMLPPVEHCACDIALAISRFLHISATTKRLQLIDGQPTTDEAFRQHVALDDAFARLEAQLREAYPYTVETGDFPREAVFHGKYQVHSEIWGSRLWNHFRWIRILVNQAVIELSHKHPTSSSRVLAATRRKECFDTITRLAEDLLVSVPSQWRHPALTMEQGRKVAAVGRSGSGAVGLPTLLWHMKIAGCAAGVPEEFWKWAHGIVEVVWKAMGMQHALALCEVMEGYRNGQEDKIVEKILRDEEEREKNIW